MQSSVLLPRTHDQYNYPAKLPLLFKRKIQWAMVVVWKYEIGSPRQHGTPFLSLSHPWAILAYFPELPEVSLRGGGKGRGTQILMSRHSTAPLSPHENQITDYTPVQKIIGDTFWHRWLKSLFLYYSQCCVILLLAVWCEIGLNDQSVDRLLAPHLIMLYQL